jgi:hypothetical protein
MDDFSLWEKNVSMVKENRMKITNDFFYVNFFFMVKDNIMKIMYDFF